MILTTPRLGLRRLTFSDAPFIRELVTDPDWLRHIGDKNVHSLADAERYLREGPLTLYEKHGVGLWAVILAETKQSIGLCGLVKRDALEDFDLGFAFLPAYRGQGYALEACRGVIRYSQEVKQLPRLAAIVNPENSPSSRLLVKLGFDKIGAMQLAGETKSVEYFLLSLTNPTTPCT